MGMMNDEARMRLESMHCNAHHKLTFESWVGPILALSLPTLFHPRLYVLICNSYITAAGLFQCLFMGMMNGEARKRLEFIN
eukprot:scaffold29140_cov50-Cyclotella_meneghiniana.AAC.3